MNEDRIHDIYDREFTSHMTTSPYYEAPDEDPEREPEECCPWCQKSVTHPLYPGLYADGVRLVGQPKAGWHEACVTDSEQFPEKLIITPAGLVYLAELSEQIERTA